MRVLFWTISGSNPNLLQDDQKADYQSDLSFIGLRELYGENSIDYPKKEFLYDSYEGDTLKLWGRGFGFSKYFSDDINIDRSDLDNKIKNNYFSHIFLSVHHSIHNNPIQLYNTLQYLKDKNVKSKIVIIDGNDLTTGYNKGFEYTPYIFKREIAEDNSPFIPISFALPTKLVRNELAEKKRYLAYIVPSDHHHENRKTHTYYDQNKYYTDYAESYMAVNVKKGGHCSFRHLEILGNGCIPIWGDLLTCPKNTLVDIPKNFLLKVKDIKGLNIKRYPFDKNDIDDNLISIEDSIDKNLLLEYCQYCLDYTKKYLTTQSLGEYMIKKIYNE